MAQWSVKPEWKKSIIERQHMTKDGQEIIIETGWRWGEFIVYTDDDNPPNIEAGVDIYNCDYETELVETTDGCWEEHDYDDCDEETREWLENFFEEGNSYFDLEEHGWTFDDCEMIIDCDLIIERLDDDGNPTGEIVGAGHASTTGRFDDEQLFYLMSRGINIDDARRLVVRGFFNEIVGQIKNEEIEDRLMAHIDGELAKVGK